MQLRITLREDAHFYVQQWTGLHLFPTSMSDCNFLSLNRVCDKTRKKQKITNEPNYTEKPTN